MAVKTNLLWPNSVISMNLTDFPEERCRSTLKWHHQKRCTSLMSVSHSATFQRWPTGWRLAPVSYLTDTLRVETSSRLREKVICSKRNPFIFPVGWGWGGGWVARPEHVLLMPNVGHLKWTEASVPAAASASMFCGLQGFLVMTSSYLSGCGLSVI